MSEVIEQETLLGKYLYTADNSLPTNYRLRQLPKNICPKCGIEGQQVGRHDDKWILCCPECNFAYNMRLVRT